LSESNKKKKTNKKWKANVAQVDRAQVWNEASCRWGAGGRNLV
jgi:hypothetical protein